MESYRTSSQVVAPDEREPARPVLVVFALVIVAGLARGAGELITTGACGAEGTLALLVAIMALREILSAR